jgi:hypothetical protein
MGMLKRRLPLAEPEQPILGTTLGSRAWSSSARRELALIRSHYSLSRPTLGSPASFTYREIDFCYASGIE